MDRSTWYGHVVAGHPELQGHLQDVKQAVESPDAAEWDKRDLQTVHYYLLRLRPGDPMGEHLRVVVRFRQFADFQLPILGQVGGEIVTAYFVGGLLGGTKYGDDATDE